MSRSCANYVSVAIMFLCILCFCCNHGYVTVMCRLCPCCNNVFVHIMSLLQSCLCHGYVQIMSQWQSCLCADYVFVAIIPMCRSCLSCNHAYVLNMSLLQSCLCAYYDSVACFLIRLQKSLCKFSFEACYFYIALLLSYSSPHIFPAIHKNMYANYLFEEVL